MKKYKITNLKNETGKMVSGIFNWGPGMGWQLKKGDQLTPEKWVRYFDDSLVAVLLAPRVRLQQYPDQMFDPEDLEGFIKLWSCKTGGRKKTIGGKLFCTKLRTKRELTVPKIKIEVRVKFAILCALEVYQDQKFTKWAENWLSGKDRSYATASAVLDNLSADSSQGCVFFALMAAQTAAWAVTAWCDSYAKMATHWAAIHVADAALAMLRKDVKGKKVKKLIRKAMED